MNLEYKNISLFDAPEGSVLVHACNGQGVWGSGIAAEFKKRFPKAFEKYKGSCGIGSQFKVGTGKRLYKDVTETHIVGILITSDNYGAKKDSVEQIKINTTLALDRFCDSFYGSSETIYSNKFNSGLFAVPWEDTELILKTVLKHYSNLTWVVCDPQLKT